MSLCRSQLYLYSSDGKVLKTADAAGILTVKVSAVAVSVANALLNALPSIVPVTLAVLYV